MALWTDVVDKFKGKRNLDKISVEELEGEKKKVEFQERKEIGETQQLERDKERNFAQGLKESSDQMKLYYARKVKEIDANARIKDDILKTLSHKIRIYNGIIGVKKRAEARAGDKKSLENKIPVAELSKWLEKHTVSGEIKQEQLDALLRTIEGGTAAMVDLATNEEKDVQDLFNLMKNAPVDVKAPEDIAKESMSQVNTILREKE